MIDLSQIFIVKVNDTINIKMR